MPGLVLGQYANFQHLARIEPPGEAIGRAEDAIGHGGPFATRRPLALERDAARIEVLVGRDPLDAVVGGVDLHRWRGGIDDDALLRAQFIGARVGGAIGVEELHRELVVAIALGVEEEALLAAVERLHVAERKLRGPFWKAPLLMA